MSHHPSREELHNSGAPRSSIHPTYEWIPDAPLSYRCAKRTIDIAVTALLLLFLLPLLVVIALAIKFTSKGPIFFRSTRLGYHAKQFTVLKFRSMYEQPTNRLDDQFVKNLILRNFGELGQAPVFKIKNDPRITPFGRILRRTSLDELPQLLSVLFGHMSLVGPRPPLHYELQASPEWTKARLSRKPGITGLWQVSGRHNLSADAIAELDIEYVKRQSILLDLKILILTPSIVLSGKGAY